MSPCSRRTCRQHGAHRLTQQFIIQLHPPLGPNPHPHPLLLPPKVRQQLRASELGQHERHLLVLGRTGGTGGPTFVPEHSVDQSTHVTSMTPAERLTASCTGDGICPLGPLISLHRCDFCADRSSSSAFIATAGSCAAGPGRLLPCAHRLRPLAPAHPAPPEPQDTAGEQGKSSRL
jgi:hypothetical protein